MTDELDKWYQSALHVLRHSLGLREDGTGRAYRNHFVPGEGSDDYPICCALVDDGLMTRRKGNELTGGADLFIVTPRGALHAKPEGAPVPDAAEAAYKWGYECLQSRMESIDRHGWAHDCDGEIEARISDGRAPTEAAPAPLLPCPFCRSRAIGPSPGNGETRDLWYVSCSGCQCEMSHGSGALVIGQWNRRASTGDAPAAPTGDRHE